MAINDIQSSYFGGPRVNSRSVAVRADKISKTAWQDLYFDLYLQTHGNDANVPHERLQEIILEDAEKRLKILKANGVRK